MTDAEKALGFIRAEVIALDAHRATINDPDTDLDEYDEIEFDLMESIERSVRTLINIPDPRG